MSAPTRKLLLAGVGAGSLYFLARVFLDNLGVIAAQPPRLDLALVAASALPCVAMLVFKALLHARMLVDLLPRPVDRRRILAAYGQSQLIRYVPGKVWGIVYQGERTVDLVPRRVTWLAHLYQMLVTNLNTVAVIAVVFMLIRWRADAALVTALAALAAIGWLLSSGIVFRLAARLPAAARIWRAALPRPAERFRGGQLALLELDWLAYYAMWLLILPFDLSVADRVLMATAYAAASLLGLLVFVMPSGWLVREAFFVWIGAHIGFGEAELLVYAALARLVLTAGDVVCAVGLSLYQARAPRRAATG